MCAILEKGEHKMFVIPSVPQTCHSELQKDVEKWWWTVDLEPVLRDEALADKLEEEIIQWGFPWFRAGVVIYDPDGKILMMHENRVQVKKIKDEQLRNEYLAKGLSKNEWVDGEGGWNLPSGRLRNGETFEKGAQRKAQAESGWTFELGDLIHIRHGDVPDNRYILPVYVAKAISGPKDHEVMGTSEIGWFSVAEIRKMHADGLLRSPEFVMDSLDAYERWGLAHKRSILVEITGGWNHQDMREEKAENMMDMRAMWNVSFRLEGSEESYCIASERSYLIPRADSVFSSTVVKQLQRTNRRRGERRWWKKFMTTLSQREMKYGTDSNIWHLAGGAHCWGSYEDTVVFAEYDADRQHGYALIVAPFTEISRLKTEFPNAMVTFEVTEADFETICNKW